MSQSPVAPSSAFAPGWYSDPSGMPANRWWDGNGWTEHLQPTGAQTGQPVAQYAAPTQSHAAPVTYTAPAQYVAPQPQVSQYVPSGSQTQPPMPAPQYATPGFQPGNPAVPAVAQSQGSAPYSDSAAVPAKRGGYNPYNSTADLANGKNTAARNALVMGIISLLVNPFCLPAIVALIWGAVGIERAGKFAKAGQGPVGKGKAIAGLVLGSIGVVATLLLKGLMF